MNGSLNSVYDLQYNFDDQSFLVHDLIADTYTVYGFDFVKTILAANFSADRVDKIQHLLFAGRPVRLDLKNSLAGTPPVVQASPEAVLGRLMSPAAIAEQAEMTPDQLAAFHAEVMGRIL